MWESILGTLVLEVTSADLAGLLNTLSREEISLISVNYCNDLVVTVELAWIHFNKLEKIAKKETHPRGAFLCFLFYCSFIKRARLSFTKASNNNFIIW